MSDKKEKILAAKKDKVEEKLSRRKALERIGKIGIGISTVVVASSCDLLYSDYSDYSNYSNYSNYSDYSDYSDYVYTNYYVYSNYVYTNYWY